MDFNNREKLIKKEVRALLVKFHKGESLGLTTKRFLELIDEIRLLDERKLFYVLNGLKLPIIIDEPSLSEEKAFVKGHNQAAEQNNFAVDLAIDSFRQINDEEK